MGWFDWFKKEDKKESEEIVWLKKIYERLGWVLFWVIIIGLSLSYNFNS